MAIRFVDIEPEGEKAGKPAAKAAPQPEAAPGEDAKLPLAKPEPKPRGRKKPLK